MRVYRIVKRTLRVPYAARAWRAPNRQALMRGLLGRDTGQAARHSLDDHLVATAAWLARAQDASGDGGVAGRYSLPRGWTSSYPETTGYIIPTMLSLAREGHDGWIDRAARAVDFLLGVQLPSGAFPGLEIAENRTTPSIFNTGQIIHGLTAWHQQTGDDRALDAALRAGHWMVDAQEQDGTWRRWTYGDDLYTYMAYAAGWLARLGDHAREPSFSRAAERHLAWVLEECDPDTGWFRRCGFSSIGQDADTAFTHTIAYTIAGVLEIARLSGDDSAVERARHAATRVARTLELRRRLPGILDSKWRSRSDFSCLTGNAQMALIWLDLHRMEHDPALVSAACKAIDQVAAAQLLESSDPGIRGGVAGSEPVWGSYISLTYPNWAAKYFIDALLARREVLSELRVPEATAPPPTDLPTTLPSPPAGPAAAPLRTVLLAGPWEGRARCIADACLGAGISPVAVLVERGRKPPLTRRLADALRVRGPVGVFGRALRRLSPRTTIPAAPGEAVHPQSFGAYCDERGIVRVEVDSLDSPEGIAALREFRPDLAIHAGAGILRPRALSIPRLGVLNGHMGILPPVRGMNAAEWSVMCGLPSGCTVHLIDAGVDTGDILCARTVPIDGLTSIQALRDAVDHAELDLLREVLAYIAAAGALPPRRAQDAGEGRQYFVMHADVRNRLERALAARHNSHRPAATEPPLTTR
jgi:hypothetical protein